MSFKTILAVFGASEPMRDLQIAAELCDEVLAHLSAIVVGQAPQLGRYPAITPAWVEQRERSLQALGQSVVHAREMLLARGTSFDVDSIYAEVAAADYDIGERAIYSDLLFVGPTLFQDDSLKRQAIGGGLLQTGRPVLLVPPAAKPTLKPKTVLLAWDSRAQCAHAAREALALMKRADSVRVTMVDPVAALRASGSEPGADVAAYLARHGIKVTIDALPSGQLPIAQVLQRHARDVAADLLVMGAYGHSRLREFIFGGVTRSMLDDAELPVLMAR
ncbi:nucleotide-binding universal stress UspA family protein [Sinorhizobium kostiense]|uniref:Nucleotide-binding universal stress UspA family protein n=1 Tax=Sinorhizobium kostiense TaxID=76747 RepID=A0ABS4QSE4_9HYPH|nr:universal stress protein [Sinorhizobium kostiense]MBP2233558.1 nucleotide-binding universal stress UspA family protein [Sinorhizobium kostiense]